MFKWYMTEKFILKVLDVGVLMYGFLSFTVFVLSVLVYPLVCTGLLVLGTDIYLYVLIRTRLLSYVLVSCRMYSSPDFLAFVCTHLLSYVLVS